MLRRVAVVRTDVSEKRSASITRMTRIGELGTKLAVTSHVPSSPIRSLKFLRLVRRVLGTTNVFLSLSILLTLAMRALNSSETFVLKRAKRRNVPENGILQVEK
jgi:hypothetical protein